jgi:transcriptional regulator with XRE-family HTH domain
MFLMNLDFPEWLQAQLDDLDRNQAKLARKAHVSKTAISDVLSRKHPAGRELCTAIASAFKMPPETVFRAAGLLPPASSIPDDLNYYVNALSDTQLREWVSYARFILERDEKNNRTI